MKNTILFITILLFSISGLFAQEKAKDPRMQVDISTSDQYSVPKLCPDPAITKINFTVLKRTGSFTGEVRVQAILKNHGERDFIAAPGQASVRIYEQYPGGSPVLVRDRPFTRLEAGAFKKIAFKRTWNSSSPSEGEFPPIYRVVISYDPDIRMDGNTQNDDCNLENNSKERSGNWFNEHFSM